MDSDYFSCTMGITDDTQTHWSKGHEYCFSGSSTLHCQLRVICDMFSPVWHAIKTREGMHCLKGLLKAYPCFGLVYWYTVCHNKAVEHCWTYSETIHIPGVIQWSILSNSLGRHTSGNGKLAESKHSSFHWHLMHSSISIFQFILSLLQV